MDKRKGTVLIIDDEKMVLDIESLMFEKVGFSTLKADNFEDACQLYLNAKDDIDLVVLDIAMNDENGSTIYKRLKEIKPGIKVLFSSGLGKNKKIDEIIHDGQNGFIQKPFRFNDLTNKIDVIMAKNN